jgi:hypothetical protein
MFKSRIFTAISCTALAVTPFAPAIAQMDPLQVIVTGDAILDGTGSKSVAKGLEETENLAFGNAWIVMKRNPEISLKVRNLTTEQNGAVVSELKQRCAPPIMINYAVDKKLKRLSARYRFDCNLPDILVGVDNVIRASSPVQTQSSKPKVAAFFIVKEIASTTQYDPDVDRSAKANARIGVTQRDSASASYQSDARSRQTSREGYSERDGSVSDSYSSRDEEKGRMKSNSTSSSDITAAEEASYKAQGRTTNKAADILYRSASPESINSNLTDVFKNASVRIFHYADISGDCPGPNPDQIAKEYGAKAEDLSSSIRVGIQKAVAACQFKYMLLGDATVDTGQVDNVTGFPKVSVVLRTKVWGIGDGFPEVLATVERTASASNPDLGLARSAAMFQVAQRVGEEVLSRLTAEGVR